MVSIATNAEAVILTALQDLRKRIIANMNAVGAYATGKTEQSLMVEMSKEGDAVVGTLSARPFFGAIETGSKPWRTQYKRPPKFFVDIIQEWADAKGIDAPAGAIAMSLMRRGSKLYRDGGRDTIYSNEIPNTISSVESQLSALFEVQILEQISKTIVNENQEQ